MERHALFVLSFLFVSTVAPSPATNKQYRTDYEYNSKTDAFYKLHTDQMHFSRAKEICVAEGAELMVPTSKYDLSQVHGMLKKFPDIQYVYVGLDGQTHESAEENPIIDLQPTANQSPTFTECDVMRRDGEVESSACFFRRAFVCKVDAKNAPYDRQCGVYGLSYQYYASVHSCYKIPQICYNWDQSYAECRAEGAHLVVLNSPAEQQAVWDLVRTAPKISNAQTTYFFFAGFRANRPTDNSTRVFRTVFNETLDQAGYSGWSDNEPNNWQDSEYCGSIFQNNGKFNDVDCSHDYGFVCEKEVHAEGQA